MVCFILLSKLLNYASLIPLLNILDYYHYLYELNRSFFSFFKKVFGGHMSFFGGHWYPCFGFVVTSPPSFKARVGSALFTFFAEVNVMYIPSDPPLVLHVLTSWWPACSRSLPHMYVHRWDVAGI